MKPLDLTREQKARIEEHGQRAFPHECCGFLIGADEADGRRIDELMPATNSRGEEELHNRFTITPEAWMNAERRAKELKLEIVGCYHSHPDHPARPSAYDLEHAWPWLSYVIVSVMKGRADAMTSWLLDDDRSKFSEQSIRIRGETQENEHVDHD